jgi:hypothetical protein
MLKKILFILAIFSTSFLIACGSQAPEEKVKENALNYSTAVKDNDWDLVCKLISSKSEQAIITRSKQSDCPNGYAALPDAGKKILAQSAEGVQFVSSKIEGEKAVATLKTNQGTAQMPMVLENGDWKVNLVVTKQAN